jgi:hypothetical protein
LIRQIIFTGSLMVLAAGCASTGSSTHVTTVKPAKSTTAPASAKAAVKPLTSAAARASASASASKAALAACHPYTANGTCYTVGEDCPKADYNDGGATAAGIVITCEKVNGVWRWEMATTSTAKPTN